MDMILRIIIIVVVIDTIVVVGEPNILQIPPMDVRMRGVTSLYDRPKRGRKR